MADALIAQTKKEIKHSHLAMIEITTELRTKFALIKPEIQELLLKDIGFITMETEKEQLEFINRIINLPSYKQELFQKKLAEKLETKEYKQNAQKFEEDFKNKALPKAKKIISKLTKKLEKEEKEIAEEFVSKQLKDI